MLPTLVRCALTLGFFVATSAPLGAQIFTNLSPIVVGDPPAAGMATPYPSSLVVAGMTGTITDVDVVLNSVFHAFPDDVDVLLVGPTGASTLLVSDAGGSTDVTGAVIVLDDEAASGIPDGGPLAAGTFRPTDFDAGADAFPPPAPAPCGGTAGSATFTSVFGGTDPNGTWSLYVADDVAGSTGTIAGGWSLVLTVVTTSSTSLPTSTTTTMPSTTSTSLAGTTTSTSLANTTTTVASTTTTVSSTSTTLVVERCDDCQDDDGDGRVDFEDEDCCGGPATVLFLKRMSLRPRVGGEASMKLAAKLEEAGLAAGLAATQDLTLQIRREGEGELLCARIPATNQVRRKTKVTFRDQTGVVPDAQGIARLSLATKKDGSGKLAVSGGEVALAVPATGSFTITVGLRDPSLGDAENHCASGHATLRATKKGLRFP